MTPTSTRLEDWIDFMEGEAGEKTRGQLSLLLEHSANDRQIYLNLRRLRQIILHSDRAEEIEPLLENNQMMLGLHDRIMKTLKTSSQNSPPPDLHIFRRGQGATTKG